jgi:hypothetical protein
MNVPHKNNYHFMTHIGLSNKVENVALVKEYFDLMRHKTQTIKLDEDKTLVDTLSSGMSLTQHNIFLDDTHMANTPQISARYVSYLVSTQCVNTFLIRWSWKHKINSYDFLGRLLGLLVDIFGILYVSPSHLKDKSEHIYHFDWLMKLMTDLRVILHNVENTYDRIYRTNQWK